MHSHPVTTPGLFVLFLGVLMLALYAIFVVVVLA